MFKVLSILACLASILVQGNGLVIDKTPPDGKVDLTSTNKSVLLKCQNPENLNDAFKWTLVDRNVEKPLEGENFQFNNGEVLVNLDDNTLIGGNLIRCKDANQNYADFQVVGQRKNSPFRIEKLPKSLSVLENRDLNITCKIANQSSNAEDISMQWYYWDTVEDVNFLEDPSNCSSVGDRWKLVSGEVDGRDDETVKDSSPRLMLESSGGVENSLLRIIQADKSHRRGYKCVATLKSAPEEIKCTTTFVRVKDTLAALWPFLGIVVEVVVLCAIIFMFERHVFVDNDVEEDLNSKSKSSPAKNGKSGLKHRKNDSKTPEKKVDT